MRWTCYLTKNREKPYRWLQAPYQKCTAMFLWTSLPSFSKSTQREHSIITVEKRDIRRSTQNIIALESLLFSNLRVGQKKMHSFGGRPRAHSNIIVIYSIVALIKTLGLMFLSWIFKYSLLMVTVPTYPKWRWLMGEGPFVAIIQRKKGSTWLQDIWLSYGLLPTESEWGVGSIHSMKNTAGFSFYHSPDILK